MNCEGRLITVNGVEIILGIVKSKMGSSELSIIVSRIGSESGGDREEPTCMSVMINENECGEQYSLSSFLERDQFYGTKNFCTRITCATLRLLYTGFPCKNRI